MIRASIVGIEAGTSFSLLNWFLSAADKKENITGFINQYWNGITTLEWARVADSIIRTNSESVLYQIASQKVSKYQLLSIMADVFRPGYPVKQAEHSKYHNKCLASKWPVRDIAILLKELREFYGVQDV
jgi:dTDP-4-dehydrorhamnose reductase